MAYWTNEAWVTSVVENESVSEAIILATSIRSTYTTRKIIAITSMQVSSKNREFLQEAFDMVFTLESVMPEDKIPELANPLLGALAKACAFSLLGFQKCIYVSASSLFLENSDKLFEKEYDVQTRDVGENDLPTLSIFMLKPSKKLWKGIKNALNEVKDFSETYLLSWLNNQAEIKMGKLEDKMVTDFCINTGTLLRIQFAPIIQFVGKKGDENALIEKRKFFMEQKEMGLYEKAIATMWLKLHDQIWTPGLPSCISATSWENLKHEPIAIVGMSCRYPGANNLEEFWNLLYSGQEGIREVPPFRWLKDQSLQVTPQSKKSQAGFLSCPVSDFDAGFFGVSPKEAIFMDPQIRLLHEVMWESLEDAGINPHSLYGSHTGIFTGSWMNDYKDILLSSADKEFFRFYMGNSIGAAAARLSFLLGLTGPSIATESGCSSAIVALDLAVKSLRNGETNLAIAGGVNLLLHPFTNSSMEYVVSPDGRCKTFDKNANGFGRAEGCGVLVLKRLSDAMRTRDNIWATIRGSAVSQEGISRSLGTPTVHCEALAMKLALQDANVTPEQVSFVETHGTGTAVGDPMEISAIAKAYHAPNRKEPLVIGSVKTNVGHTESCSGITGIMKAVLAMQHEIIPKHRNLETLNPEIFLDSIPAMIPMENLAWPKIKGQPRICGVSSFGITGTDGHVILEESPDYELPKFMLGVERPIHLMIISGKTKEAFDDLLEIYVHRLSEIQDCSDGFAHLAYTANVGRACFNNRAFILARNCLEAGKMLREKKFRHAEVKSSQTLPICFLFTGQGSQHQGMAKTLYETSPVFRMHFDACDRMLRENYNLYIQQVLWDSDPNSKEISRTVYSQTSIFCVEFCLFKLWQSWGIQPDYVLGHSLGEFCAAVAAGVLTFEDALKLVAERSRLIDNLPRGSMLVVKVSKPEVEKRMKSAEIDLDFAAVNNPDQTVVAGDTKTVETFLAYLKGQGIKAIILEATHAFHSRDMNPMLEEYHKVAQSINYKPGNPNIQYVSGMEGRLIDDVTELGPDYWVRHTREKVSFIDACAALKESECTTFLEVGPQPVLSSFVMSNSEGTSLNCLPSLRKGTNDWETILTSLGKLYLLGYQVDWEGFDAPYSRKKVSLPFHPFHRKSFWVEGLVNNTNMFHPLLGHQMKNASAIHIFQNNITSKSVPYLKDHCIGSRIIFPGACFTEMCLSAGYCVANGLSEFYELPSSAVRLKNLAIEAPLEIKENQVCHLQTIVDLPEASAESMKGFRIKISHLNSTSNEESRKWVLHTTAWFEPVASTKDCMSFWNPDRLTEILSNTDPIPMDTVYKQANDSGIRLGNTFRIIRRFWAVKQQNCKSDCDEIVAEIKLPPDCSKYLIHPVIIDSVFQAGALTVYRYITNSKLKVPVRIGSLTMLSGLNIDSYKDTLYIHVWQEKEKHYGFISTPDRTPLVFGEDLELLATTASSFESVLELQTNAFPDSWEENWRAIPGPNTSPVPLSKDHRSVFENPEFVKEFSLVGENSLEEMQLYDTNKYLLSQYIVKACQELGWKPEVGQEVDVQSFCFDLGVHTQHSKLIRFYLTVLQEDARVLDYAGNEKWVVAKNLPDHSQVLESIKQLTLTLKSSEMFSGVAAIQEIIAENLADILTGKKSALDILFPTDKADSQFSAEAYYKLHPSRAKLENLARVAMTKIFKQVESLDKNLNGGKGVYRVLEVGAGTGSLARPVLSWLSDVWGDKFELYYTDISPAFFVKADTSFQGFRNNIKFEVFNIEQSPLSQGIPLGYFDVVYAQDVLHATRDLEETLVHLRQTLRPGGVIFICETVSPARDITFVFGLLEGYWRLGILKEGPITAA